MMALHLFFVHIWTTTLRPHEYLFKRIAWALRRIFQHEMYRIVERSSILIQHPLSSSMREVTLNTARRQELINFKDRVGIGEYLSAKHDLQVLQTLRVCSIWPFSASKRLPHERCLSFLYLKNSSFNRIFNLHKFTWTFVRDETKRSSQWNV